MAWEQITTIRWVSDLGGPTEPDIYRFKGAAVPISQEHIRRAETALADGAIDVIFEAIYSELACGERRVDVGAVAGSPEEPSRSSTLPKSGLGLSAKRRKVDDCRKHAEEAEAAAESAQDQGTKQIYREIARRWSESADQLEGQHRWT